MSESKKKKIPATVKHDRSPVTAKDLKKVAHEAKRHVEGLASMIRKDFKKLIDMIQAENNGFHNRLLIIERTLAKFPTGAPDLSCACGHPRGGHGDQNADGACQMKVVIGNAADPMGERQYADCPCEKFSTIAIARRMGG